MLVVFSKFFKSQPFYVQSILTGSLLMKNFPWFTTMFHEKDGHTTRYYILQQDNWLPAHIRQVWFHTQHIETWLLHACLHESQHFQGPPATDQDKLSYFMPACININFLRVLLQHNKLLKLLYACLHESQYSQGPPATQQVTEVTPCCPARISTLSGSSCNRTRWT